MVMVSVYLNGRCCSSGCVGIASYQQSWRRWVSASSSFSIRCCWLWLLISSKIQEMTICQKKKMNFRCSGNGFFMLNKRFSYSMNDFSMFNKWFLYSANDFYIQQEIYIFINFKFASSNMRLLLKPGPGPRTLKIWTLKNMRNGWIWKNG